MRASPCQVADVRDVMMKNIDKVLERGEKLDTLVDKADNLRFQVWIVVSRRRATHAVAAARRDDQQSGRASWGRRSGG